MNPRWRAYLNRCESRGEKPKNFRYQIFISNNLAEFYEKIGKNDNRRMTDEEHEEFTEFLLEKYPAKEAMTLAGRIPNCECGEPATIQCGCSVYCQKCWSKLKEKQRKEEDDVNRSQV